MYDSYSLEHCGIVGFHSSWLVAPTSSFFSTPVWLPPLGQPHILPFETTGRGNVVDVLLMLQDKKPVWIICLSLAEHEPKKLYN